MQYDFSAIEKKWQEKWEKEGVYITSNDSAKPKCYILDMFPYPSGAGLHVGHPLGYIASDIFARYKRSKGYNVLHPMGFDAFGLPAEQYAIETGQHPAKTTKENINRYKEQLKKIGFSFDWSREVVTADASYYKWTQWIFLQLFDAWYNPTTQKAEPIHKLIAQFKAKGYHHGDLNLSAEEWKKLSDAQKEKELMKFRLAYKSESLVNWCPALGTVLANDEVINGVSERGGHPVERKQMSQWFLRISSYADRLLNGLEEVDFPEPLKDMQRNWIGRSEGAEVLFPIKNKDEQIKVFTTRPDTIFGVSFLVLAPEHELVKGLTSTEHQVEVDNYIKKTASRSERERMSETKRISGCFTGSYAIHPITGAQVPIWIADYVLLNYGTGAIMAVPAGDERDFNFARNFKLPILEIFEGYYVRDGYCTDKDIPLINSDMLNGMNFAQAFTLIVNKLEEKKLGAKRINFRMRDAGFSRQRYWGEPFPILTNEKGEYKKELNLPLVLPEVDKYSSGPNGKGPLANLTDWVSQGEWMRETDTMPGYAASSWYFLRYMDPKNTQAFVGKEAVDYWNQVDVYVGGAEHAVGHLLYSRFWCKVLFDLGYIGFEEPFKKLVNQGMIQGNSRLVYRIKGKNEFISADLKNDYETEEIHVDVSFCNGLELNLEAFKNWRIDFRNASFILSNGKYLCGQQTEKMSKRLYNVVNPDDIVEEYGADTFRMYEMFLGPVEDSKPWDTKGIEGVYRFLRKLWRLFYKDEKWIVNMEVPTKEEYKILHQTIEKVERSNTTFSFNTGVSQFMICVNELGKMGCSKKDILEPLLILLSSYAPHMAEELWQRLGHSESILNASYPILNKQYLVEDDFSYPIAFNGKVKFSIILSASDTEEDIREKVKAYPPVIEFLGDRLIKKLIVVKGRMINLVV